MDEKNLFYNSLYSKYYNELVKLKHKVKKRKFYKRIYNIGIIILIIFSLPIMSDIMMKYKSIIVLILYIFIILTSLFVIGWSAKSDAFQIMYPKIIIDSLLETSCYYLDFNAHISDFHWKNKCYVNDYAKAKFPIKNESIEVEHVIKKRNNKNMVNAVFYKLFTSYDATYTIYYSGLYFSFLANHLYEKDIYIRSKKYDNKSNKKLPYSKLNIDNKYYNIYAENYNVVLTDLLKMLDEFYELTNINVDLTLSNNRILIRFDWFPSFPIHEILKSKEDQIFDRENICLYYTQWTHIDDFLKKVLSRY